jgi:type I restriction enzyme R subunit
VTEDQLEQETLGWLQDVGYTHLYGPDIAHDGTTPERSHYRQVLLPFRLREAILRLNPTVPTAAREDALKQIQDLSIPALLSATSTFTACWSLACQCSTRKTARPVATLCA